MTPLERERIRIGIGLIKGFSTENWRHYFAYLLGRPVTLTETDQFLREDFHLEQERGVCSTV